MNQGHHFRRWGHYHHPHFSWEETELRDTRLRSGKPWPQKWAVETQKKPARVPSRWLSAPLQDSQKKFKHKINGFQEPIRQEPPSLSKTLEIKMLHCCYKNKQIRTVFHFLIIFSLSYPPDKFLMMITLMSTQVGKLMATILILIWPKC